jgi:hypothetical protein
VPLVWVVVCGTSVTSDERAFGPCDFVVFSRHEARVPARRTTWLIFWGDCAVIQAAPGWRRESFDPMYFDVEELRERRRGSVMPLLVYGILLLATPVSAAAIVLMR